MAMKYLAALLAIGAVCSACQKNPEPVAAAPTTKPNVAPNAVITPPGGSGQGIAPMGPNVGGMTPVSGTDSVVGSGGGSVGMAAKGMARKTAASAGAPAGMSQGTETGE